MSKYNFNVKKYRAIESADIKLDGITVLAGINGCGKSTISRLLYYVVNGTIQFDQFLYKDYINSVSNLIWKFQLITWDLSRIFKEANENELVRIVASINSYINEIIKQPINKTITEEEFYYVQNVSNEVFSLISECLLELAVLAKSDNKINIQRVLNLLGIGFLDNENISKFLKKDSDILNRMTEKAIDCLKNRKADSNFWRNVLWYYNESETDNMPDNISFKEDNVEILGEELSKIFDLNRVIYVDTPMAITSKSDDNIFWNKLREMMMSNNVLSQNNKNKKMLLRINKLLGGHTEMLEDELTHNKSLRYVSDSNRINIDLKDKGYSDWF